MAATNNYITLEEIPIVSLSPEVRRHLILYHRYNDLFYDKKTRKVTRLRQTDVKLRSGFQPFETQEGKRIRSKKLSKEAELTEQIDDLAEQINGLLDDDKSLRNQLVEMQDLVSNVPQLKSSLQTLNMEYQEVKAENDQMIKIVNEVLETSGNLSSSELMQELRDIIKSCKENMNSQAVKNDDLLVQLRGEVDAYRQSGREKDLKLDTLSRELQESKENLNAMKQVLLEAKQSVDCEEIQRKLNDKEAEVDHIREELESLNSQNESLMSKLSQRMPSADCSMYVEQISSLQQEFVDRLDEQVVLNKEMNEAQREEIRAIQLLLDMMKEENETLLNANKNLKSKLKDCEESTNEIEIDILKLENSKLQVENDKLQNKLHLCRYEEQQEITEYEDELYHELEEKVKEKDKIYKVKYTNEQLAKLSRDLIDQNDELLRRLQFYAEHLCDLCDVDDTQKQEMVDDIFLLKSYGDNAKNVFETIAM
uniref:Uncharacterized protein n=1 Tax=viral metagenome TaxID=1070528 RepID=A0A6C0KU55_9ZZZZ